MSDDVCEVVSKGVTEIGLVWFVSFMAYQPL